MLLIAHLLESFFQFAGVFCLFVSVFIFSVLFPSLPGKIHYGKVLAITHVLLTLVHESLQVWFWGVEISLNTACLMYPSALPYLPLPHKVSKALAVR